VYSINFHLDNGCCPIPDSPTTPDSNTTSAVSEAPASPNIDAAPLLEVQPTASSFSVATDAQFNIESDQPNRASPPTTPTITASSNGKNAFDLLRYRPPVNTPAKPTPRATEDAQEAVQLMHVPATAAVSFEATTVAPSAASASCKWVCLWLEDPAQTIAWVDGQAAVISQRPAAAADPLHDSDADDLSTMDDLLTLLSDDECGTGAMCSATAELPQQQDDEHTEVDELIDFFDVEEQASSIRTTAARTGSTVDHCDANQGFATAKGKPISIPADKLQAAAAKIASDVEPSSSPTSIPAKNLLTTAHNTAHHNSHNSQMEVCLEQAAAPQPLIAPSAAATKHTEQYRATPARSMPMTLEFKWQHSIRFKDAACSDVQSMVCFRTNDLIVQPQNSGVDCELVDWNSKSLACNAPSKGYVWLNVLGWRRCTW
jgi:hypothetical protein